MSAQPDALARQAGLLGWSIGSKPARQRPFRDVPSLDWTVRVKGNRTRYGIGSGSGHRRRSAGQRLYPSVDDQGRGQVGI
ncbi:hypothetical protein [Thiobacillus sp.]|uniref:hypothetical protein n=1 Tax=Thiobacillus sp. TaxID=924 RepID=UPI0025D3704C|nr:hypothetical protein [Thiobacillus sp.]